MNRLTVVGRIVRDVEIREVGDGRVVMNNTIAVPRNFKTENGPEADFINFVAWGKRAELIEEYTNKGDLIGLDGRFQSRNYENEDKQKIYVVEMVVETVHFLQPRRRAARVRKKQESEEKIDESTFEHIKELSDEEKATVTEKVSQ